MLGLSFSKLVFLIVVVAVVWYGFKWIGRAGNAPARRNGPKGRERTGAGAALGAEDTVKCPVCETYVVARQTRNCGRAGCPYPG